MGVSSQKLENLIKAALDAEDTGAFGAKLSGAGGGDCMIAIAKKNNLGKIKKAIKKVGGEIIKFEISGEGVMISGKK